MIGQDKARGLEDIRNRQVETRAGRGGVSDSETPSRALRLRLLPVTGVRSRVTVTVTVPGSRGSALSARQAFQDPACPNHESGTATTGQVRPPRGLHLRL